MTRMVRDYFDVQDQASLDELIAALVAVRDALPAGAEDARVRMRGDDVFGRRLTVSFLRPQTADEVALDARYGGGVDRLSIAA
jgi:hypothetical protein